MVHGDENCSLLDDTESQDEDSRGIPFRNSEPNENFNSFPHTTMEHCHSLLLLQRNDKSAEKVLRLVAFLSAIFIILEFTGGVLANSLSIMTDAGHMLSDFLSFVVSIVMIRVSKKPATRRFSFGYMRAEIIGTMFLKAFQPRAGHHSLFFISYLDMCTCPFLLNPCASLNLACALISVFIIWALTIVLVIFATQRIWNGQLDVDADTMIVTACLGVVFNIIMGLILKFCNSGAALSGHAHSHNSTNVNVRAALIHVFGDFVQSVGVLVAAVLIKLFKWELADPLSTYMFSLLVLCTSVPVLRDILYVLMESTPSTVKYGDVYRDLLDIDGVLQAHSLNIWSLSTQKTAISVHLVVGEFYRVGRSE